MDEQRRRRVHHARVPSAVPQDRMRQIKRSRPLARPGAPRQSSPIVESNVKQTGAPARTGAPRRRPHGGINDHRKKPSLRSQHTNGRATGSMPTLAEQKNKKTISTIPALKAGDIRVIPLGGVEEIGKNMTAIEIGNDIIVIDAGFQFQEEDLPGVDYVIPNTAYLEENKAKVRAVFITHGHLDHIGGIPYIMEKIGNPVIYTRSLTAIMIKKRQEEFPHLPALNIVTVDRESTITVGEIKLKFFAVTHTIPDSMGLIISTPYGHIVTPGDVKLDHVDGIPTDIEQKEYGQFSKEKVLLLLMDSTNVDNPGFSTPERLTAEGLEHVIKNTKRRLIIGTFASQIERMIKIIEAAEKFGKKVVVEGRSMKNNIEIVRQVGMMNSVKKETIITSEEMEKYPPDRIVVLATGAQGDEFAALMRMSNKTHKYFKVTPRDTILLSSSIVPGNEKSVQKLKDNLARLGAKIIHYRSSDVYIHSSGHGNRGELEWIHKKVQPKFFVPIHGSHYMLRVHEELAQSVGMPHENIIVPDNGMVIEIQNKGEKIIALKERAPGGLVTVDGFAIGDVQEVVMRDRKMLAKDGMFVIIATINVKTGTLKKSPDIISRGFIYLRESQELLSQTRLIIKKSVEDAGKENPINFDNVKDSIADNVQKFLFQKTAKTPIVIPVVLGV